MRGKTILKTLCVGLLLTGVFGATATGCSSTSSVAPSEAPSSENSSVAVTYTVDVECGLGAYAYVDAKTAATGDSVKLTVVLTDDAYDIVSVKVGSEVLKGAVDSKNASVYTYTYVVKAADVKFVVETKDVVASKAHRIAYSDAKGLSHADGLSTRADVGEEVTFSIGTVSGYSVEGLEIYYLDGEDKVEVEFTGNSLTGYKFKMPNADVIIEPTVLGAYFATEFSDEVLGTYQNAYGRDVEVKTNNYIQYMYVEAGKDDDGNSIWEETKSYYARAGQKCVIVSKHDAVCRLSDFIINGEKVEADETHDAKFDGMVTYSFVMPNSNSQVKAEVVNGAEVGFVDLSLDTSKSEHLDVEMFKLTPKTTKGDDGKDVVTYTKEKFDGKWKYGETIYIAASSKEGTEGYEPKTLIEECSNFKTSYQTEINTGTSTYEWGTGYSYSDTHKASITEATYGKEIADEYAGKTVMQFTPSMSTLYTSIKISVVEKYAQAYKDEAIVKAGTFYGGEFYTFTTGKVSVKSTNYASNPFYVAADGTVYNRTDAKDSLPEGYDGSESLFKGQSGFDMFYDGGTAFAMAYSSYSTFKSDLYVCSSKLTGTNSTIKLIYNYNYGAAGDAFLYGFYQDGEVVDYLLLYVDSTGTLKGTSKITVEVTDGTDPFVADAKVTVKDSTTGSVLVKFNITDDSTGGDDSGSTDLTSLNGNYDAGSSIYFNIYVEGSTQEITYLEGTTEYNVSFTYDATNKRYSFGTMGAWDGTNYFTVNEDGSLSIHLDDQYNENTVNLTATKMSA